MKRFVKITYWQLMLLVRYNILLIALIIGIMYCALILSLPVIKIDKVIITLIFSDPAMLGFIFIGVLILFEKSDNTLPALVVTPLKCAEFLWSKALALLIPALIVSFAIAFSGYGFGFNPIALILGVGLSSVIFTFLGFIGAARVKTFNQYIIVIPVFLAPSVLPILNFFDVTNIWVLNIIPTYSMLYVLFGMAEITMPIIYSAHLAYLVLWIFLALKLAKRSYYKYLMQ
jgi:fluoroquinolone transport system permease protein